METDIAQSLADSIRHARERRHLTQDELAIRAGVSARSIRRIENGQRVASETIRSVAAALDVDAVDLPSQSPAPADRPSPAPEGVVSLLDEAILKTVAQAGERIETVERPHGDWSETGPLGQRAKMLERLENRADLMENVAGFSGCLLIVVSLPGLVGSFAGPWEGLVPYGIALAFGLAVLGFVARRAMGFATVLRASLLLIGLRVDADATRYVLTDRAFWKFTVGSAAFRYVRLDRDGITFEASELEPWGLPVLLFSDGRNAFSVFGIQSGGSLMKAFRADAEAGKLRLKQVA